MRVFVTSWEIGEGAWRTHEDKLRRFYELYEARLRRGVPSISHRQLAIENLVLRQQLVYKRTATRPRLRTTDRLFWVGLARVWTGWRQPS